MPYSFQNRLSHVGSRFDEIASEDAAYIRGATTLSISVVPILKKQDQMDMSSGAVTRVENQEWAINVEVLGVLFPPKEGDVIRLSSTEEFKLLKMDEDKLYRFTTSTRDRILVSTRRTKLGV